MPRGPRRSSVQKVDYVLFYLRLLYSTITHLDESLIEMLVHESRVLRRMIGIRYFSVHRPSKTEEYKFWRDCESVLREIDDTSGITCVTEIALPPLLSAIRDYFGITLDECGQLLKESLILHKISIDTPCSYVHKVYDLYFILCKGIDGQFYSISCTSSGYFDYDTRVDKDLIFSCSFRVFQFLDPVFCPFPDLQEPFSMPQIVKHMVEFWSVREIVTSIKREEGLLQFRRLPSELLQIILSYLE